MSLFMILLLSIGLPVVYLTIASVCMQWFYKMMKKNCRDLRHDHGLTAFTTGLIWPIAAPGYIMRYHDLSLPDFSERRREREIAKAQHELKLAKIRAQELELQERAAGIRY